MFAKNSNFVRLWKISPLLAVFSLFRRAGRKAKQLLPADDWNTNLGEEMRPHNSLHN
jgi:hypothetical protein